jgi:DUF1680 family protein
MENHAKYGDSIYFHDGDTLFVNQFIASELDWGDKRLRIRLDTRLPDEEAARLTVHAAEPTRLVMRIRHPAWCRQATVTVNGRVAAHSREPGRYIDIDRLWRPGDVVRIALPMHLHLQPLPNAPDVAALMFGPVVLAARLGSEGMAPGADLIVNERTYGDVLKLPMDMPTLPIGTRAPETIVRRNAGPRLSFTLRAAAPAAEHELVPFHRIAHERYHLYWQLS